MINAQLHQKPVALDRELHRNLKVRPDVSGLTNARTMNAMFLNAVEFGDASHDYAIIFVRAGENPQTGKPDIAPMAVLGLAAGENLYIDGDRWDAEYVPAMLRAYPFALAPIEGDQYTLCFDESWDGLSQTEGRPLFEADGQPSQYLEDIRKYVEALESEVQRTRALGQRLVELDLMQDTRFDATLPDGQQLSVDGFMVVDEKKLAALPDAVVLELHRNGVLHLIHAHRLSMGKLRRLVARRQSRLATA